MDSMNVTGLWWLPSDPENPIGGVFTFSSEEGAILKLIGSFNEDILSPGEDPPVILGLTEKNKIVTLAKNNRVRGRLGIPGYQKETYRTDTVYLGAHFNQLSDLHFFKFSVDFTHLTDWARTKSIRFKQNLDENGQFIGSDLSYTYPQAITASTDMGLVSIQYNYHDSTDIDSLTLRQNARFHLEMDREIPLEEFRSQFLVPIQNLISLATDAPNHTTGLIAFTKQEYRELPSGTVHYQPIEILYRDKLRKPSKRLLPYEMIFTLDKVTNIEEIINKWLAAAEELDYVYHLYFAVQKTPEMYMELQFLSIMHALETYHRRRKNNQILSNAEHKKRVKSIRDSVPEEYREWISGRLINSNEPSLAQRLSDLMELTSEVITPLIYKHEITDDLPEEVRLSMEKEKVEKIESFIKKIKDTRNYFTHFDKSLEKKILVDNELFDAVRTLSFMMLTCLLFEIGFSPEKCANLLEKNPRYKFAINER